MEISVLTYVILGLSFNLFLILVDSQNNVNVPTRPSFVGPPPPPRASKLPPPPRTSKSPPPPQTLISRPYIPPPPPKHQSHHPSSPPHLKKNATLSSSSQSLMQPNHNHTAPIDAVNRDNHGEKNVHHDHTMKKIGLVFIGIAGVLQIGVVGFLVFKRQQLFKIKDRSENSS